MNAVALGVLAVAMVCLTAVAVFVWLFRVRRHRHVILAAVEGMLGALHAEPAPHRLVLSESAALLLAQDKAAENLEASTGRQAPIDASFHEFNQCADPAEPLLAFLRQYAFWNDPSALTVFTGDAIRRAMVDAGVRLVHGGGDPAAAATAIFDAEVTANPEVGAVPRLDGADVTAIVADLDALIRKQLDLVALVCDQAEAVTRKRLFRRAIDLGQLRLATDAVGETLRIAAETSSSGSPVRAVRLLAGLDLPVPDGLPGRTFHREVLTLIRPMATVAVAHRVAVAAWASASRDRDTRRAS